MGNKLFSSIETTIFEVISGLARESGAINLGQGFPDDNGPDELRRLAAEFLESHSNQYPPMMGVPELRRAVAEHDRRFYNLDIDWQTEVMVTSGATEALAACFLGLLNPGDEAVVFEPLYDSYVPMIERAGATAIPITLTPPTWTLPADALETVITKRTKLVVLNSPLNPAGKVFTREELERLSAAVLRTDAVVVCDEVYEHLVFSNSEHVPLATLPGMHERCIRIGSAGKTFSLTGWKVGYVRAPNSLLGPIAKAHQFLTFTTPPNLQRAVAVGLAFSDDDYRALAVSLEAKRDQLASGLIDLGFTVATCDGTYFLNAGFSAHGQDGESDVEFCRRLIIEAKVAAIPVSAFYLNRGENSPDISDTASVIRFCFCKSDETLDRALENLRRWIEPT